MSATPQRNRRARRLTLAALAVTAGAGAMVAAALPAGAASGGGAAKSRTVDVQLLSFNDFHGTLEAPQGSSGTVTERQADGTTKAIPAGGVEYLATGLREARKGHEYSVTAAAGDMIGGSPMLSGLFHDEPTVEALNKLKLDVTSVGNHEFDEGKAELRRMAYGGCHPVDGCFESGKEYTGAEYKYLAANVTDEKTKRPLLNPTFIWKKGDVKIGFIGVTLEGTPDVVTADGVKGLKFGDEVETINKYAAELNKQGVKSIVALIHEGGLPANGAYNYDCDVPGAGAGVSGAIVDIAKNVDPKVDALVTGHTHQAYACNIPDPAGNPRMVTSAASYGRLFTDTTLTYDRQTKDIVRTAAVAPKPVNKIVSRNLPKAPDMTELITRWNALAAPVASRPMGFISADIAGRGSEAPEKPLGDLIADAQLEATAPAAKGGAQLAIMNPGGIRADLAYKAAGAEGDGVVTYGESYTVQPFNNLMNIVDLTGAQLITALQQQVSGTVNGPNPKILQVSKGFTYTLDMTKTGADRIVVDSVKLNGAAIDPAKTYRVAMNEFLAGGGDGFTVLKDHKNKLVGVPDLEAFNAYLAKSTEASPIAPPAADRITVVK
ncbi:MULTISPECIES: bifunctional metallophosphatase/5'-nucleotidase [Streptomyces]|uniref:bifunctional metallophosphatase/5'-nucleotidase n=1 Tax=Streptomyces TaxID=1883 RepID=UPI00017EADE1|nr:MULTISPECIES: bifunctional metallophosphatase/5'-nucleotidase [Streptomyces]AKL66756.1 5'-nucleotidase [Streptomyces sp. Mg1]EDX25361.1 secreted 5'-nucleotidase [Streptomyces sp. Mg1]RPK49767.1 Endonuclease YhcR precursor [Streptomyces sp. ADI91-18]WBY20880.1 bifunctional metallophosphatase/5'-nucleotidase [Streptomyces goshikiensis]WSR99670.1 bifunctional metallophosphatase/5'-nucleotidase [Streptomyces goshikiensis]